MPIFDRISSILRANINDLLDHAEDPEAMLNQIIRDMDQAIIEARNRVADMIAEQKLLEGRLADAQQNSTQWERKAELAVGKNQDDLAREALRRKNDYDEHVAIYQKQVDAQRTAVQKLKRRAQP